MPIETVVRNIDLAANEPLSMWRLPLQNRVPLFEPMQFLSHARPETFRVGAGFGAQLVQLIQRLNMGLRGKGRRWREDSIFMLQRFNVCSG